MQSFIVISKDLEKRQEFVEKFCIDHGITQFDQTVISEEGSIGIEIVRKLQKKLYLKPFQSKEKILVIENAEKLTIEAQNALLKILEEPPLYTYSMLSATSIESFLPTVVSRCKIIVLEQQLSKITPEELVQYASILHSLQKASIGKKLALAEEIGKDKTQTILWLEKAILIAREEMLTHTEQREGSLIKKLQQTYTIMSTTNVSPRLAMENLFLTYV